MRALVKELVGQIIWNVNWFWIDPDKGTKDEGYGCTFRYQWVKKLFGWADR